MQVAIYDDTIGSLHIEKDPWPDEIVTEVPEQLIAAYERARLEFLAAVKKVSDFRNAQDRSRALD